MKKFTLIIVLSVFSGFLASAQEDRKFCHTTEKYLEAIQKDPSILQVRQQLEDFTQQYIQQERLSRTTSTPPVYVIPVVFHIIHNYGPENISDDQVIDAVNILTRDYRKRNADTIDVIPQFANLIADCEIEFRLANIDPNGNCTNGIDRIASTRTYNADDDSKLNSWDNHKYLNIWVINSFSASHATAAAYANYPGANDDLHDGIIARYDYVGSFGASDPSHSRTLTHEVGHSLNLSHPWGSNNQVATNCGDDNVSDTPITLGWESCVLNGSVCNPPIIENVQNYMDYSYCDRMFTPGQAQRMRIALNSGVGGRNNLWQTANLIATGTDGSPIQVCAPNADFKSNYQTICVNSSAIFTDLSWNGKPTSWLWTFQNGTPATSTDSMPTVLYSTAGIFAVTLQSTNATGTDSVTKSTYIRVSGAPSLAMPFTESFEDPNSFPGADGYTLNPDNGQTWMRVNNAAFTGTYSIRINNYSNTPAAVDDWVTPAIDFSNVSQPTMTFFYANAQRNSGTNDALKFYGSYNCGRTWYVKWSDSGPSLSTAGIVATTFTPTPAQWRQISVNLNQFQMRANVRFMFENVSDRGNNTYIDSINITGTILSVDQIDDVQLGIALYPNPSTGNSKIQFQLENNQQVKLIVNDMLGNLVTSVVDQQLNAGMHEYEVNLSAAGIYFVDLVVNGKHHARKLLVSRD